MLESTERQTKGTLEHQQVLLTKLDEMGTKIFTTIASELTGMRADIDRMNTLHKASTDIYLAQLHGINDPTKVAGPSTIDATTPSPTDGLKLTFRMPPTLVGGRVGILSVECNAPSTARQTSRIERTHDDSI